MSTQATAATVVRVYPSLKFVKNDLRSTITVNWLNSLILPYIHKDIGLNYEAIMLC